MEEINVEMLVSGATIGAEDVEMVSTPYEAHDVRLKAKRRHTQPAYSLAGIRTKFRELKLDAAYRGKRLLRAAGYNDVEKIAEILKNDKVDPNTTDEHGRTALHVAASRGYAQIVQALLQAGADVNAEDRLGNTPMHLAVYTGSVDTVFNLLKGGCRLKKTTKLPYTPLQLAQSKYCLLEKQESILLRRQKAIVALLRQAIETDFFNRLTAEARKQEIDTLLKGLQDIELNDSSPEPLRTSSS